MHPGSQGESSGGPSVQPIKRRRSRPRKEPSLNDSTPLVPPGFEGPREYPKTAESDYIIGQAVSGVVESTFDGGCILSIKIGDSNKNSKCVVFKPGHYDVTAENDVAPRIQMIRSRDVHSLSERSQGLSRGQGRATKTASTVPTKRKSLPYMASSVPAVGGGRGTVTPVILQPVNFSNSVPGCSQLPSDASETEYVMTSGNQDFHMDQPISMLPPGQSVPFLSNQTLLSSEVGSEQNYSGSFNDGTETSRRDEGNPNMSTYIDTSGSSEMSGVELRTSKEVLKSSAEDLRIVQNNDDPFLSDSLQTISGTNALFNFGTGRRTKLLPVRRGTQAVQRNVNENPTTSGFEVEIHETRATDMDPKD